MRRLLLAGLLLLAGGTLARAATKTLIHRSASAKGVRAVLSYESADAVIHDARLQITRRGVVLLDAPVAALTRYSHGGVAVRDLDLDREPEVILDIYTGGAHCCIHSLIYRYDRARRRYRFGVHDWGNVGFRIVDLDQNGQPEFSSADDRFAYAFASFAGSVFPPQIWHFDHGRFLDVTRHFPAVVAASARTAWRAYLSSRRTGGEIRGALAAWLADEYLLGRESEGWRRLDDLSTRHALGPNPAAYLDALRAFLVKLGYAPT